MSGSTSLAPLVLLHPFPLDAGFWDGTGPELAASGRWVCAVDFPGLGQAPLRDAPTIDRFADEVAETIATRAPGGRAVVAGLSMGGYAALALAARHPGGPLGLVLASTRAEADDPAGLARRAAGARQVREEGLGPFLDGFMPALTAPDAPAEVVALARTRAERQRPEAVARAIEALAGRADRRPDLGRIDVPALVISGSEDPVTPPATMRALAEGLPDAELVSVPGAGHLLALERPDAFLTATEGFLGRVGGR